MPDIFLVLILSVCAGITIPLGAHLAQAVRMRSRVFPVPLRHAIVAFGGGVLLSAVAFVLVPEGIAKLSLWQVIASFAAGGLCFFLLERALSRAAGSVAQLLALVLDFVPEALAMGAALASGEPVGLLLALLIATQNLPEGFNAFDDIMEASRLPPRVVLISFWCLVLIGPLCAFGGYAVLAERDIALGAIMLFASAGIIYLTFEDIAPAVPVEHSWSPPLGAVAGFLVGIVGHIVLG